MTKKIDEIGNRHGRLVVVSEGEGVGVGTYWNCVCDCGNEATVRGAQLRNGHTQSCGCLNKERVLEGVLTHGMSYSKIYSIHKAMKGRCYNENNEWYKDYGGRGIRMCDDRIKFEMFHEWAKKSGYREGLSIERIDVNGDYEPSNCKWIKPGEQTYNRRMGSNNSTGYSGISLARQGKMFNVRVSSKHVGSYDTFIEAYRARREAEMDTFGKYLYEEPDFNKIMELYTEEDFGCLK